MEKVVDDLQCLALVVPIRWQNETVTRDNLSTQQIIVNKKKRACKYKGVVRSMHFSNV